MTREITAEGISERIVYTGAVVMFADWLDTKAYTNWKIVISNKMKKSPDKVYNMKMHNFLQILYLLVVFKNFITLI